MGKPRIFNFCEEHDLNFFIIKSFVFNKFIEGYHSPDYSICYEIPIFQLGLSYKELTKIDKKMRYGFSHEVLINKNTDSNLRIKDMSKCEINFFQENQELFSIEHENEYGKIFSLKNKPFKNKIVNLKS